MTFVPDLVRSQQSFQRAPHVALRARIVDRTRGGRTRAIEPDPQGRAGDVDLYRDPLAARPIDAVVVELDAGLVSAVRELCDPHPHGGVGPFDDPIHGVGDRVPAVAVTEAPDPLDPAAAGRQLCGEVAPHELGNTDVGLDEAHQLVVGLAGADQPLMREADPLLVHVSRVGCPPAGALPADIGPVSGHDRERDQHVFVEDGRVHRRVRDVCPGQVRVVHDQYVSLTEPGEAVDLDAGSDGVRERADEPGDPGCLRPEASVGADDAEPEVLDLVQEGVVCRSDERAIHLERGGRQAAPDHLGRDGIDRGHKVSVRVSTRLPSGSVRAVHPGGTSVVEVHSSMIAGPTIG